MSLRPTGAGFRQSHHGSNGHGSADNDRHSNKNGTCPLLLGRSDYRACRPRSRCAQRFLIRGCRCSNRRSRVVLLRLFWNRWRRPFADLRGWRILFRGTGHGCTRCRPGGVAAGSLGLSLRLSLLRLGCRRCRRLHCSSREWDSQEHHQAASDPSPQPMIGNSQGFSSRPAYIGSQLMLRFPVRDELAPEQKPEEPYSPAADKNCRPPRQSFHKYQKDGPPQSASILLQHPVARPQV